jgi:uncharacterized membrane protein
MVRLIKFLLILVVISGVSVTGFAFLGDLSAPTKDVRRPVTIDVD